MAGDQEIGLGSSVSTSRDRLTQDERNQVTMTRNDFVFLVLLLQMQLEERPGAEADWYSRP